MKEIKELLKVTGKLREKYPDKKFSLDGKLVGDIGEILAAEKYGLELYSENAKIYDGFEIATGRRIQIKSSFKNYCYFPFGKDRIPDFFLAINILESGHTEELFNGPGLFLYENYIVKRGLKAYQNSYYTLSKGVLLQLNDLVDSSMKIKQVK